MKVTQEISQTVLQLAPGSGKTRAFIALARYCQDLGAPEFDSPQELARWIRRYFKNLEAIALNSLEPVIALVGGVESKLFRSVRRFLLKVLRRVRAHQSFTIKAIITPLRLNPHSLHPIDATTHWIGLLV